MYGFPWAVMSKPNMKGRVKNHQMILSESVGYQACFLSRNCVGPKQCFQKVVLIYLHFLGLCLCQQWKDDTNKSFSCIFFFFKIIAVVLKECLMG